MKVRFALRSAVALIATAAMTLGSGLPADASGDTTPPSKPQNLRLTGTTLTTISFAWDPSTDNVAVRDYDVYRDGAASPEGTVAASSTPSYTSGGLNARSSHSFLVIAHDSSGNASPVSDTFFASTPADTTSPSTPTNLTGQFSRSAKTVTLSWTASTDNYKMGAYEVWRDMVKQTTVSTTSYVDSSMSLESSHKYFLRAVDYFGNVSSSSSSVIVNTSTTGPDTAPPSAPAGLAGSVNRSGPSVSLTWTASTDDVGVAAYDVFRGSTKIGSASTTSFTDTAPPVNTAVPYSVVARDAAGNVSGVSNTSSVYIDTQAPTAPTGLSATAGSTSVSLAWSASTDNVGVAAYDVYRGGSKIGSVSAGGFTDGGPQQGATNQYVVIARDAAGNASAASNTASVFVAAPTPTTTWFGGYASDLTMATVTNGVGPVERDMSNGGAAKGDGTALKLAGASYAKGLGTWAPSKVTYSLGGDCSTFTASAGVDDAVGSAGSVVFQVWTDGVKIYDSGIVTGASSTKMFSETVTGAQTLELVVTDGGNGSAGDDADWVLPKLTCSTNLSAALPVSSTNGLGPVEIDSSNGNAAVGDGTTMKIGGTSYDNGLGTAAQSDLVYSVNGHCSSFSATVGIDDEVGSAGSVVFQVWGDGVKLFDSGTMTGSSAAQAVSVSISGRQTLELMVNDGGDGNANDHGDWALARVACNA